MCMVFVFIQLVEGTVVHYYYLKGKHQIRLRRKNLKHSLKVFEQGTEQNGSNFSKFGNPSTLSSKNIGKWKKNRDPLTYEPPPPELVCIF